MFILNYLNLNNIINQALVFYQTLCPKETMLHPPFLSLAQWKLTYIKENIYFHNKTKTNFKKQKSITNY